MNYASRPMRKPIKWRAVALNIAFYAAAFLFTVWFMWEVTA